SRLKKSSRAASTARSAKSSTSTAATEASRNGSEPIPVIRAADSRSGPPPLEIDAELTAGWLVSFLREEFERRGFEKAVVGLSGGVDSAWTPHRRAEPPRKNTLLATRMPTPTARPDALAHDPPA